MPMSTGLPDEGHQEGELTYTDIRQYPSVSRDLALLVDKSVKFEQMR